MVIHLGDPEADASQPEPPIELSFVELPEPTLPLDAVEGDEEVDLDQTDSGLTPGDLETLASVQPAERGHPPDEDTTVDASLDPAQILAEASPEEPAEQDEEDPRRINVRSEAPATSPPVEPTRHISEVDHRAPVEQRAESISELDGPVTEGSRGAQGQAGNNSPDTTVAPDQEAARRGEKEAELRAPIEQATPLERKAALGEDGLGQAGGAQARGPGKDGDEAGGRQGSDSQGAGARAVSTSSRGGPSEARAGSEESPPPAPEGWLPMAVRVDPSVGRAPPTLAPSELETPERSLDLELVQARGERAPETQGSQGEQDHSAQDPQQVELDDAPAVTELEVDGADTPQTSPGWGGDQVLKTQTQASVQGTQHEEGAPALASVETLEQELEVGPTSAFNARADEHAGYYKQLEEQIDRQWRENTPTELKAMGVQGTVRVRITVDERGRVLSKEVVRHSDYEELEALALNSIPKRVARPPKALANPTFVYSIDLTMKDGGWASNP